MKKILILCSLFTLLGCDLEESLDCVQAAGDIVQEEFLLDEFRKILVFQRVELIVQKGPEQKVIVETGDNLINEVNLKVVDSTLFISDRNSCNLVRDFGITKVFVTSPNLKEIQNSSERTVRSIGVLEYERLDLISDDREDEDAFRSVGDFDVDLKVDQLSVVSNGISEFYLRGRASFANIGIFSGDSRVEAADLDIGRLTIFHRGSNKVTVRPRLSIRGTITGLGDVVAKNRPDFIEVEELFRGRLIFEED